MSAYKAVTERLARMLDQGIEPWDQPGLPMSLSLWSPYRGINVFLLAGTGRESPWWGTFNQIQSLGGRVRRGEHGLPCVYWTRDAPVCRTTFNLEQCEDLDEPPTEPITPPGAEAMARLFAALDAWDKAIAKGGNFEMLSARMTCSLMARELGVFKPVHATGPQSAAAWASVLRASPSLALRAGAAAQRAVDEAMGRTWQWEAT